MSLAILIAKDQKDIAQKYFLFFKSCDFKILKSKDSYYFRFSPNSSRKVNTTNILRQIEIDLNSCFYCFESKS